MTASGRLFVAFFLSTTLSLVSYLVTVSKAQVGSPQETATAASASSEGQGQTPDSPIGVASPAKLDFGPVLLGQTSPKKRIRLTNKGDAELIVSSIALSGPFALPVNHCTNGVKPGTHCDVYVTFSPEALETESGTLTFMDNASNNPQSVPLTGTGANSVPTVTRVSASPKAILAGQPIALQATVASLGGGVIPDGEQVVFLWHRSPIGSATLHGGVANFTTTAVYWRGQSTQKVEAQYVGDANFNPSDDGVDVFVTRYSSTVTVSSSPNPSVFHQPMSEQVSITSSAPFSPGGHVIVSGACARKILVVSGGGAGESCDTVRNVGTYQNRAFYEGDGYTDRGIGTSTHVVNPASTTITLESSKNPSREGHSVKFSVIVRSQWAPVVTGSVTFTAGGNTLGTVPLSDSRANIETTALPVGTNTVTATYTSGNGNFITSSASIVQIVK